MEHMEQINLLKSKVQSSGIPEGFSDHLTDFDYLRFLQGHGMDVEKSIIPLKNSILFHHVSPFSKPDFVPNAAAKEDASSMYFGRNATSSDGYLLTYDRYFPIPKISQLDVIKNGKGYGITDVIQNKLYMHKEMKADMHPIEAETGKQSGLYYVIDLKGIDTTPSGLMDLNKLYTCHKEMRADMHAIEAETGKQSGLYYVIDLKGIDTTPSGLMDLNKLYMHKEMKADMHAIEAETGKQIGLYYVIDLKGIDTTPSGLMDLVKSSFKDWSELFQSLNPEDVKKVSVINAPGLLAGAWNAISGLFPARIIDKVKILGKSEELLQDFDAQKLPTIIGGSLDCSKLPENVKKLGNLRGEHPINGYSKEELENLTKDLQKTSVPKGQALLAVVELKEEDPGARIEYNFTTNTSSDFGIFHKPKDESCVCPDKAEWVAPNYSPLISLDVHPEAGKVKVQKPGFYYLRIANRSKLPKKLEVTGQFCLVSKGNIVDADLRIC